jgi:pyruvate ferredoxin oxidoreductase gamma subunit
MVYQFKEGIYKNKPWMINLGPDYHHCKGCLRCVEICPTEALVAGIEKDHRPLKSVRNLMLLVDELDYEAQGASSWITSESNSGLTKVDGGIK